MSCRRSGSWHVGRPPCGNFSASHRNTNIQGADVWLDRQYVWTNGNHCRCWLRIVARIKRMWTKFCRTRTGRHVRQLDVGRRLGCVRSNYSQWGCVASVQLCGFNSKSDHMETVLWLCHRTWQQNANDQIRLAPSDYNVRMSAMGLVPVRTVSLDTWFFHGHRSIAVRPKTKVKKYIYICELHNNNND